MSFNRLVFLNKIESSFSKFFLRSTKNFYKSYCFALKKAITQIKHKFIRNFYVSKIVIVTLEYKRDLSRLNVIELDKSKKINEVISI
ncbi:MAG: hypothetical protein O7C59_10960 [Rickettsia endosymbiont of Ixodes persulcatus]|nr:hypothetical protein [Rickettsia endosymbiont of Ixodes persulcatus]